MTRNRSLDGARGIAALMVLLGHCMTHYAGPGPLLSKAFDFRTQAPFQIAERLWHTVFNADAAVLLFFVLSGYVLTTSLKNARASDAVPYLVRRAFRLFPVSIAAALPLLVYYQPPIYAAFGTAFLFDHSVNGTIWSLQVELIGCVLIFALAIIDRVSISILTGAALMLLYVNWHGWYVPFLPAFVLGSLIPKMPKWLFGAPSLWAGLAVLMLTDLFIGIEGAAPRWAQAAGAFFVVGHLASHRSRLLESKPMQFIGDVSYPLYLIGIPVMLLGEWALTRYTGHNAIRDSIKLAAASLPVGLFAAWILHRYVEQPWIAAGKALLSRLGRVAAPEPISAPASIE